MRRLSLSRVALLTPLLGLGVVCGPGLPARAETPPSPIPNKKSEKKCGAFGTSVEFADSPPAAARRPRRKRSSSSCCTCRGNFEDPRFT